MRWRYTYKGKEGTSPSFPSSNAARLRVWYTSKAMACVSQYCSDGLSPKPLPIEEGDQPENDCVGRHFLSASALRPA